MEFVQWTKEHKYSFLFKCKSYLFLSDSSKIYEIVFSKRNILRNLLYKSLQPTVHNMYGTLNLHTETKTCFEARRENTTELAITHQKE
jgi:hypothetical protein